MNPPSPSLSTLTLLLDGIADFAYLKDIHGRYLVMNASAANYIGKTPAETIGQDDFALFPKELAEMIREDDRILFDSGLDSMTFDEEFSLSGSTRFFQTIKTLCRDATGNVTGLVGVARDVTERKALQRELEQRSRELFEAHRIARLGTWSWDRRTDKTSWSEETFRIFGRDPALGEPGYAEIQTYHTPHGRALLASGVERALRDGTPYEHDVEIVQPDGSTRWITARGEVEEWEAGQAVKLRGTLHEITGRIRTEEALRRSEKLATAGRLAASIAHEINNPLESVTNALYLALQDPTLSTDTRSFLRMAERELARVAHITTQSLRFHKQSKSSAPADLGDVMDSVLALFNSRLTARQIDVERDVHPGAIIDCFSDEIRQVFANLISNSLDATAPHGRIHIRIKPAHAWDTARTPGARVLVADTGSGIPPEAKKRIFEPFFSTKEATGLGLGLWVSDGILRKHNARLAIRSRTGDSHGTAIALFFPQNPGPVLP